MNALVRAYTILFCIVVGITEINEKQFAKWLSFLSSWIGKGMAELFIGVLTLSYVGGFRSNAWETAQMVSSWLLIGVGALYVIMGIFGGQAAKEKREQNPNG